MPEAKLPSPNTDPSECWSPLPPPLPPPLRLDVGCGDRCRPGYVGIDRKTGGEAFPLRADPKEGPLRHPAIQGDGAVPDGVAAEVRASHVLEHFSWRESGAVLREWIRVLAPGGRLQVAVPDFDYLVDAYRAWRDGEREGDAPPPVEGWLMGGQTDADDFHHAVFTRLGLEEAFRALGLADVGPWASEQDDCAAAPCTLNVQGWKPGGAAPSAAPSAPAAPGTFAPAMRENRGLPERLQVSPAAEPAAEPRIQVQADGSVTVPAGTVRAILSLPRLAFTDTMFCCLSALLPLAIPLERHSGVFWNQSIERLFSSHLDDGTELLLSLDYDSVFTTDDVRALIRIMATRPEIDALCALQSRREKDGPLLAVGDWQAADRTVRLPRAELAKETLPASTGHFGLTLHRVSALRHLPRPWLRAAPAPDGTWGEGRLDADIAHWHAWKAAGLTLHVATHVVIGHLEMVATFPDGELRSRHLPVGQYVEHGKPAWAWR